MSGEMVVHEGPAAQLAPIGDPSAFVASYVAVADELANIVRVKKLATRISGRDHVRVEGWTLLGSMLGVFPVTVWTREMRDDDGTRLGWEARVEARTRDGAIVGAAEAECMRSEKTWKSRDDYALRSMAQTRATSKALRQPLGFVMTLAGFDPTPAEEMPRDARPLNENTIEGEAFESPADRPLKRDEPMWKKLNVLYGKITKDHEYRKPGIIAAAGGDVDQGDDWATARDRLSFGEARDLIDKMERALARFEAQERADAVAKGTPLE